MKTKTITTKTLIYMIFTLYVSCIVLLKVSMNTLFSILVLLIASMFVFDARYSFFVLLQLYLLRRYLIINDTLVSTIYSLEILIAVIFRFVTKKERMKFPATLVFFISSVVSAELTAAFIDLSQGYKMYDGIKSLLSDLTYIIFSVDVLSNSERKSIFSNDANIRAARVCSLFCPMIVMMLFYVLNVPLLQRAIYVSDIIATTTTAYTRVDPNFLSVDLIILSSMIMRRDRKEYITFLALFFVFNIFYLFSVTGFVLLFVSLYFIIREQKKVVRRLLLEITLFICALLIIFTIWTIKYIPQRATVGNTQSGITDFLLTGRVKTWRAYLLSIADAPLFGHGNNTWRYVSRYLGFNHLAHNSFLQNFANYGILYSASIYLIIIGSSLHRREKELFRVFLLWFLSSLVLSYWGGFPNFFCSVYIILGREAYIQDVNAPYSNSPSGVVYDQET